MELLEHGTLEGLGFSDKDSVQTHCTPEKLSSVIDFNEALNTFSEMYIAGRPVSHRLESETEAKCPSKSRLNEASKQINLFPAKTQENVL